MVEGNTFGKRYEKKFIVNEDLITDLLNNKKNSFSDQFEFDHKDPDSKFTIVENLHFDSPDLHSYHDSMEKKKERYKLRIRYYAQNGLPEQKLFFEIKSKVDKETQKVRVAIKKKWLAPFLAEGIFPKKKILAVNPGKSRSEIMEIMDQLTYFIHEKQHRPILKSSYMRFAFKLRESSSVRLTFDRDIRYTRLSFSEEPRLAYEKEINPNDLICEVKIGDPKYMDLIERFTSEFGKASGFSKYCYGIWKTKDRFLMDGLEASRKTPDSFLTSKDFYSKDYKNELRLQ